MAKLLGAETLVFIAILMNLNPVFTFLIDMEECSQAFLNFELCVDRIANRKNVDIESRSSVARKERLKRESASWGRVMKLAETVGRGPTGSTGKSSYFRVMDKNYLIANRDCLLDAFTVRDFISFCKSGKNVFNWAMCVERKIAKRKGDDDFDDNLDRKENIGVRDESSSESDESSSESNKRSSESDESSSVSDESSSESDESSSESDEDDSLKSPMSKVDRLVKDVEDCVATMRTVGEDYDRKEPLEPVQPRGGNQTAPPENAAAASHSGKSSTSATGR